ncbi:MAG: cell wall-active antibiotics response protein [Spirochaetaceae bacterium]|jgi:hypothetical protein|nr:cell wall-active antibiotics response protein [Spirochaetaceae bacterium]
MELSLREEKREERRNRAIEALSVQFSHDALPLAEYERLLDYINKAESDRELSIVEKIVDETARYAGEDPEPYREPASTPNGGQGPVHFSFALLASRETRGDKLSSGVSSFISILGSNAIEIREGDLPPGQTEMDAVSVLGETRITVPPGVAVTMKAFPIAGETTIGRGVETRRAPGGAELVITGIALLGNISVRLRKEKRRR